MIGIPIMVVCYVMGGIPFGVMIGKLFKGIDIRDFGSGNIGFTNVYRTLGPGPASLVFVLDTAKGLAAVLLCRALGLNEYWTVSGALLSVLGHCFSIFLGFKGGRGVATSLGVIIGLNPVIAAIAFGIWVALVALTRYVSVASLVASVSVPLQMVFWKSMDVPVAYKALGIVAATAIVLKHASNVKRLVKGTEPKFGQKAELDETTSKDKEDE